MLSIVPGLGQAVNGDALEGAGWFVTSVGLYFSGNFYASNIGFKIWEYNMYDAYRDAGAENAAKDNVLLNYTAFLNPLNLIDPFSVGIIGIGTFQTLRSKPRPPMGPRSPVFGTFFYGFVGLGEEGLFRGFLFPEFSSLFSSKIAGAAASSVVFSLSHLTNKQPYYHSIEGLSILFLGGMLLCWQTSFNNFDLKPSIFAHTWFDIVVDYGRRSNQEAPSKFPISGIKFSIPL